MSPTKQPPNNGSGNVQVIARSFAILRAISESSGGLRLGDLAREVELPRSTTHRIVRSLEAEGVALLTTDGRVRIGPDLIQLAATQRDTLIEMARPLMRQLSQELSETVDLAVLSGTSIRFVAQESSSQRLRADSVVGELFPAYCTANGKALLAELSPRALELALPRRLARQTPKTITSRAALMIELEEIRKTGVAYDREEHTERICAVGATVHDALGGVGALTIAAPAERFYGREKELSSALLIVRGELSAALGA